MVSKKLLKQEWIFSIITLSVVVLDQLSKFLIRLFQPDWTLSFLKIQFIKNTGAGFGILAGQNLWLGIVSLAVALGLMLNYKKLPKDNFAQVCFALFLGGAIGNMIDRLFVGYVTDFINLQFWPAFNIADSALSIAIVGLMIYYFKKKE